MDASNHRNGISAKIVLIEGGPPRIDGPPERDGSSDPALVPESDQRFDGFDEKIVAMYARGMTVRELQGFLTVQYGTGVFPEFASSVTDAAVRNEAVSLILGLLPRGTLDILGIWIQTPEAVKFWLKVFKDLKTRVVGDILIALSEGLKRTRDALAALLPVKTLQICILHLIRNSLDHLSWMGLKVLAQAVWRRAWDPVIPVFALPPEMLRVIYTTTAIDSVTAWLHKTMKTRSHFPSDGTATK